MRGFGHREMEKSAPDRENPSGTRTEQGGVAGAGVLEGCTDVRVHRVCEGDPSVDCSPGGTAEGYGTGRAECQDSLCGLMERV